MMNKMERALWEEMVDDAYLSKQQEDFTANDEVIIAMDVYVRKLERELQALKHKKAVAAILQKGTST